MFLSPMLDLFFLLFVQIVSEILIWNFECIIIKKNKQKEKQQETSVNNCI